MIPKERIALTLNIPLVNRHMMALLVHDSINLQFNQNPEPPYDRRHDKTSAVPKWPMHIK